MGGDSFGFQTSLLGLAAGGDFEVHDSHKSWNSKYTQHFETGIVIHVTSGNVTHNNLNSLEVHATANVLTMHVDVTPLNVHVRPVPIGIDVHIENSGSRKHVNVHRGHHHHLVSNFHQESQAVHIVSTIRPQTGWERKADIAPSAAAGREGMMTLEADRVMSLSGTQEIRLKSGANRNNPGAKLELSGSNSHADLASSNRTTVSSDTRTIVKAGVGTGGFIIMERNRLSLQSDRAVVTLRDNKLTTNATGGTRLNGKVSLGEPTVEERYHGAADDDAAAARRAEAERVAAERAAAAQAAAEQEANLLWKN